MRDEIDINSAATEVVEPSACSSSKPYDPTIRFVEQTAAGSARPLYAPACAWFRPLPHDGQSAAENEKEPRGDLQVKRASAEDELYQDPASHQSQTPDEVLHKAAAAAAASSAAAEARKRRMELTKLKHHHARTKTS